MENKTILITGGAGFIGCHLIEYLLNKYPDYQILNLDSLTYAGDLKRLDFCQNNQNYKFIEGDICNQNLLNEIFSNYKIDGIFHLAAESHVDNSIASPQIFVETNINGTFCLLEAAKEHCKEYWQNEQSKFLHVSTDEVFGSLGNVGYFSETTPYAPNSPYSASKASSDFLVRSYFHTYNLPVIISNCSNNFGPKQHDEKLIPTIIRKALKNEPIPIYGNGENIRDWLYVNDHASALDRIYHSGKIGESYNIGTQNEKTNVEIAELVCKILDDVKPLADGSNYNKLISYVKDRAGHDFRYAIDNTKITNELKWQSDASFDDSLTQTVKYYIDKYNAI